MAIASDDLRGDGLRLEPELAERDRLDLRIEISVDTHCTGDLADRDCVPCADEPARRADDFGVPACKYQPRGDRLGMNAVRAADRRCGRVLARAFGEHVREPDHATDDPLECTPGLDREARIE